MQKVLESVIFLAGKSSSRRLVVDRSFGWLVGPSVTSMSKISVLHIYRGNNYGIKSFLSNVKKKHYKIKNQKYYPKKLIIAT